MSHEVGVDPFNDSRVYISDLKQVVHRWVTSGPTTVKDLSHIPVLRWCLASQVFTSHTDGHPWLDVQEQGALPLLLIETMGLGIGCFAGR